MGRLLCFFGIHKYNIHNDIILNDDRTVMYWKNCDRCYKHKITLLVK